MMKNVLLIGAASLRVSPYINNYINLLKKNKISYDLVCWNRDKEEKHFSMENYYAYNNPVNKKVKQWKKAFYLMKYSRFVIKHLRTHQYEKIVVFTIVNSLFLQSFLRKYYQGRYIVDIRDYSPVCKVSFIKNKLKKLIYFSSNTVISSAGFLKWLPIEGVEKKIVVAHNIAFDKVKSFWDVVGGETVQQNHFTIRILTIGQIRDFTANATLIRKLNNHSSFHLLFCGVGPASNELQLFANEMKSQNVTFTGRYEKADEDAIVRECDMINIFFDHGINSDTLMSNRFYLSVLHRKPMIVTSKTYQAELVSEFNLGVVLESQDDFCSKIEEYWQSFDKEEYERGCRKFLKLVEIDMNLFQKTVLSK